MLAIIINGMLSKFVSQKKKEFQHLLLILSTDVILSIQNARMLGFIINGMVSKFVSQNERSSALIFNCKLPRFAFPKCQNVGINY